MSHVMIAPFGISRQFEIGPTLLLAGSRVLPTFQT